MASRFPSLFTFSCCNVMLFLAAAGCQSGGTDKPRASADGPPEASTSNEELSSGAPSTEQTNGPAAVARQVVDDCAPPPAPPERTAGSLTVRNPPERDDRTMSSRMRSHNSGTLSSDEPRTWVGPPVRGFVPLLHGSAELHLLDGDAELVVAVYRDMYGTTSCQLFEPANCDVFVRGWDRECGHERWTLRLNDFMSRPDHLEVQDVRVADGVLYFNEACQSYSKEANGECSALLAVDPVEGELLWRSEHLVSNNEFIVHGDYIIAGYGFTAEPDYLHVVRREDGDAVHRLKIASAHNKLRVEEDAVLIIERYYQKTEQFLLEGFDGASPELVRP